MEASSSNFCKASLSDKVVVTVPPGLTRTKLELYFQKQHGDNMLSVVYPVSSEQKDTAVVKFKDKADVEKVLNTSHQITRKLHDNIPIKVSEFPQEILQDVTTCVDIECIKKLLPPEKHLDDITDECGVVKEEMNGVIKFNGDLYQITKLYEILEKLSELPQKFEEDSSEMEVDGYDSSESAPATEEEKEEPKTLGAESGAKNGAQNVVTLDKDIFKFMKINKVGNIQDIMKEYSVKTKEINDAIMLEFRSSRYEQGITKVQKIYQTTQERIEQVDYKLPPGVPLKKLNQYISAVEAQYQYVVISLTTDTKNVLFIGSSVFECSQAKQYFKNQIGDTSMPSSESDSRQAISSQPTSEFQKLFEHTYPSTGLIIRVVRGDIAKQSTDAIVNAANDGLRGGGGVTGAIYNAGGFDFEFGCRSLMHQRNYRPLDIGEVLHTDACGRLQCKHVLHVVGPIWKQFPRSERRAKCVQLIDDLCWELIQYANKVTKSTSIGIPAISTGIYGVPMKIFCDAMLFSIKQFQKVLFKGDQTITLREIRLVNFVHEEAKEISEYFKKNMIQLNGTEV